MFSIEDGRKHFYQWDLNRKVKVADDSIKYAHFSNAIGNSALVVEVKDGLAAVPNILLQDSFPLLVYGYDGEATKYSDTFEVVKRNKPDSYVYTETEVLNYNQLMEKLDKLNENVGEYVNDYLIENPIEVDLSDYAKNEDIPTKVSQLENDENYIDEDKLIGYLDNLSDALESQIPDVSEFITEDELNSKGYLTAHQDLSDYAKKNEIPNIEGLATEEYVKEAVAAVEVGDVDLSNYYTKSEVVNLIPDTSGFALSSEIPDVSDFITAIPDEYITEEELSGKGYATETYVDNAIGNIKVPSSGGGGSVAVDNTTIIQNEDGTISTAVGGSRTLVEEAVALVDYADDVGITTYAANNTRFQIPIEGYTVDLDLTATYRVEMTIYDTETDAETEYYDYIYTNSTNNVQSSQWQFVNNSYPKFQLIKNIGYNEDYSKYYLWIMSNSTSNYEKIYIRKFQIIKDAVYNYNYLDAGFIKLGKGLILFDGGIASRLGNLTGDEIKNSLIQDNNTINSASLGECVAFGTRNTVGSQGSAAIGRDNAQKDSLACQYSIGDANKHIGGFDNYTFGRGLTVSQGNSMALGFYNIADSTNTYPLIVGIGNNSGTQANGFTLDWEGNGTFAGQVNSTGSDYAEYFEWMDGNPDNEDRVGYMVALDGEKIRLATPDDEVLGIVSSTVAILGDNYEWQWQGKYETDDFGRVIYDLVEDTEVINGETYSNGFFKVPRLSASYNAREKYIPRNERPEWAPVGLLGKLYVRDDGSCKPNDYVAVGTDGIATVSSVKTNMRVMSRKTDNIIRVYVK